MFLDFNWWFFIYYRSKSNNRVSFVIKSSRIDLTYLCKYYSLIKTLKKLIYSLKNHKNDCRSYLDSIKYVQYFCNYKTQNRIRTKEYFCHIGRAIRGEECHIPFSNNHLQIYEACPRSVMTSFQIPTGPTQIRLLPSLLTATLPQKIAAKKKRDLLLLQKRQTLIKPY